MDGYHARDTRQRSLPYGVARRMTTPCSNIHDDKGHCPIHTGGAMKVYLIGAGPGDPGLLTLKAKSVLEGADVIVYDYLANDAFLDYAKPGAEIIYVGKKGGDHTLSQDGINALIVAKAKEGKDRKSTRLNSSH